jgi:diadenosine tetraphosphate (Ap4A) HIT family hydrolase
MDSIYDTENFVLVAHPRPEVDRMDGGHMKINPKIEVEDRTKLSPRLAIELMRFTVVAGEAMKLGLKTRGVDVGRINYQDNGNWTPHLHIHLYGRSPDAKYQKWGDPINPGHEKHYKPLNEEDKEAIRKKLTELFSLPAFSDKQWGLS